MQLIGIYTMHTLDRTVMGVVLKPIKRELGLGDKLTGAITALANDIASALTSIPLRMLADWMNRVRVDRHSSKYF